MDAKRWSGERVFSRRKEQGRLERHCYFDLRRVSAHTRLQMLMSLAAQLGQALAEAADGARRGLVGRAGGHPVCRMPAGSVSGRLPGSGRFSFVRVPERL